MFCVWWSLGSSNMQILILGLWIIVISLLTSAAPLNKVIARNFPSTKHQGTLPPRSQDIMPTVRMITGSWTANKCTHTNWLPKHGIACYNSMGAPSIHLLQVLRPLRFRRLLIDPTPIVRCNLIARLSSHRACIRSHKLPLNRPSRLHLEIKHTKCVLYELFVNLAMKNGHARNKAWL